MTGFTRLYLPSLPDWIGFGGSNRPVNFAKIQDNCFFIVAKANQNLLQIVQDVRALRLHIINRRASAAALES